MHVTIRDDVRDLHRQVADDLTGVGPEAPAGVAGWTAADLAAHLMSQTGAARYGLAAARLALARGVRLSERAGPSANARSIRFYKRRGFEQAVETVRQGPPWPLLLAAVAPVALFEIWVHGDDLRRANNLGPSWEPESLSEAIKFLKRYHRPLIGTTSIPSAPDADVVRWLTGRPSSLQPHDPPLRI